MLKNKEYSRLDLFKLNDIKNIVNNLTIITNKSYIIKLVFFLVKLIRNVN